MIEFKKNNQKVKKESFDGLYKKYFDQVYSYFYRRTLSKSLALELTQDTFLKVFKNMEQFDYKCPINFWIFKIAHNIFCSNIKRSKIKASSYKEYKFIQNQTSYNYKGNQERKIINNQYSNIIVQQLLELPEMMRKCVIFHIFHGLTYREISKLLCISINTVKTHLREGMKKLRQRFEEAAKQDSQSLNDGGI